MRDSEQDSIGEVSSIWGRVVTRTQSANQPRHGTIPLHHRRRSSRRQCSDLCRVNRSEYVLPRQYPANPVCGWMRAALPASIAAVRLHLRRLHHFRHKTSGRYRMATVDNQGAST